MDATQLASGCKTLASICPAGGRPYEHSEATRKFVTSCGGGDRAWRLPPRTLRKSLSLGVSIETQAGPARRVSGRPPGARGRRRVIKVDASPSWRRFRAREPSCFAARSRRNSPHPSPSRSAGPASRRRAAARGRGRRSPARRAAPPARPRRRRNRSGRHLPARPGRRSSTTVSRCLTK